MPVVACPKCKTKFKLSSEQLGKAVRCNSCQTKFRTAAPATAGKAAPKKAGASKAPAKPVAAPPAKKKPRTLEEELFASAPLKPGTPDPLGNFVLEDPGFGAFELPEPEEDDSDEDLFADRQHLMNNPALKGRNPYAAPSASGSGSKGGKKHSKKLRQPLLKHEGEIKSLGLFYFISGILGVLLCGALFVVGLFASADSTVLPFALSGFFIGLAAFLFILTAAQMVVGWFLFKLQTWAKIATTILLVINLLGFPLGTIFSAYFLWTLHGEKGKTVFSKEYREAVEATPDLAVPYSTLYFMLFFGIGLPIGYGVVKAIMG